MDGLQPPERSKRPRGKRGKRGLLLKPAIGAVLAFYELCQRTASQRPGSRSQTGVASIVCMTTLEGRLRARVRIVPESSVRIMLQPEVACMGSCLQISENNAGKPQWDMWKRAHLVSQGEFSYFFLGRCLFIIFNVLYISPATLPSSSLPFHPLL